MAELPTPIDPFNQLVGLRYANGTEFSFPLSGFESISQQNTREGIAYGSQIGASLTMLIVLFLLTPPDKRRSPVFFLNTTSLLLNVGRILTLCIFYTAGWSKLYVVASGDFANITLGDYANSVLGTVLATLLVICTEVSLLFQTQVLCSTLIGLQRHLLLAVSSSVVLVVVAFRLVQMVFNCNAIVTATSPAFFIWLQNITNILTTMSICYFSAIFVAKLGFAIHSRRRLGLTGFGAMQVIFIMSCQSMIIPCKYSTSFNCPNLVTELPTRTNLAIFAILQYFVNVAEMAPLVLTLVVLTLPLSSMWAAQAVKNSFESDRYPSQPRPLFAKNSTEGSSKSGTQGSMAATLVSKNQLSPDQLDRLYPDLEAGETIQVKRDFTICSEKASKE